MKIFVISILMASLLIGCKGTTLTSKSKPEVLLTRPDAEIAAAAQKSRAELPGFLSRLQHPNPGEKFALNANFMDHATFEHMWVDHLQFDGKTITGKLADTPVLIKKLRKGSDVMISKTVIYDWLILSNGKTEGGYVQQVLDKRRQG